MIRALCDTIYKISPVERFFLPYEVLPSTAPDDQEYSSTFGEALDRWVKFSVVIVTVIVIVICHVAVIFAVSLL